jgi:hypothetical protein
MALALQQDLRLAMGYKKQVDLATPLAAASDFLTLQLTNTDALGIEPINEDNAQDLGKGVYATNVFPSNINTQGSFNGRMTAEAMALISAFWCGKTTKTTAGSGYKYTHVAPNLQVDGLDLPATSAIVNLGAVRDLLLAGIVCNSFGFQFQSGPGRDNATFTSSWVGTGAYVKPSGITIPAPYSEHSLNAGGISTLALVGFDYLASKRFVSLNGEFNNNLREQSAYFPGSGSQGGYQLRGRMRRGAPTLGLTAVVECDSGSSEEDALLAQTEGTGVIVVDGPTVGGVAYQFKITYHRLRVLTAPIGDSDGIASYSLTYSVLEHASNGVFTIECTVAQNNILAAAA